MAEFSGLDASRHQRRAVCLIRFRDARLVPEAPQKATITVVLCLYSVIKLIPKFKSALRIVFLPSRSRGLPNMDTGTDVGGFSTVDYAIFGISLAIPAIIGIYYGCFGAGQKTSRDVLLGSSKLGVIPVALALIGTYTSAVGLLGYPSEVYHLGGMLCYYLVVYAIVFPAVAFIYLPIMYPLKLISVYEYLEMRFSIVIRRMASFIFCFEMFLYISVVLYAPALALSSVTPMSITTSTLVTGLLATFYTTLGGSNAVVWTSALQVLLVIAGAFAIIISGCMDANGIGEIWAYNVAGLRMDFSDVRIDPRVRHSVWSVVIGGTFTVICQFTSNQMGVQRYFSMSSLRNAQKMILWNVPLDALCLLLLMIIGMILYHAYGECDPRMLGLTTKVDQILPFYVMNKLSYATGLPGLFVSAIYGAGLSTLSSGFTALAAVLLQDVVTPIYRKVTRKNLSSATSAVVSKLLACASGLIILGLAFAVGHVQSNIIQIALSIFGIVGGPLLGVFFSGMFLPFTNSLDVALGMIGGLACTLWIGLGTVIVGVVPYLLPLSTNGCHSNGTRPLPNVTIPEWKRNHVFIPLGYNGPEAEIYKISYQYYSLIGFLVTLILVVFVHVLTGCKNNTNVDPRLLSPLVRRFCKASDSKPEKPANEKTVQRF